MKFKLKPNEARAALIKALRSGEYKQCQGRLHNTIDNTYCCLGVATDLFCKLEFPLDFKNNNYGYGCFIHNGLRETTALLPIVQDWLGFKDDCGCFNSDIAHSPSLMGMNDSGKTFNEIADVLEVPPPGMLQ